VKFAIQGLLLTATICLLVQPAWTQVGQVRGEVRINDGQAVTGVVVIFDRQDGGFDHHYELESDDRGDFLHLSVEPGDYEITFEYDGGFYLTLARVSPGDFEIQLDLDRLEYAAYEFDRRAGAVERVQRDIRRVSATARIVRAPRNDEEAAAQEEEEESEAGLREAFAAGREAMEAEDYDEAIRQFTMASHADSRQHSVHANLGSALERAGRHVEAAASFEEAQTLLEFDNVDPEDTNYFRNLTVNWAKSGEVELALGYAERSAEVDPDGAAQSFYDVGALMTNQGNNDGALQAYEKAIDLDPNMAEPHYQAAIVYLGGEVSRAVPLLERYLELAPDGPNAQAAQGLLEFARQNQ
jgi:tetratricopeptide (TPR) repeat protein